MPATPANNDYRQLLDEKFKNIHDSLEIQFNNVNKSLTRIEEQTIKTNGRVLKLEEKVIELEKKEITHVNNCPQNKKFEHLEKSISELKEDFDKKLEDVNFFIRNPKLGLAIIVIAVLVTMLSVYELKIRYLDNLQNTEILK